MTGATERRRQDYTSKQQQSFRRLLRDVARDTFVQKEPREFPFSRRHADILIDVHKFLTGTAVPLKKLPVRQGMAAGRLARQRPSYRVEFARDVALPQQTPLRQARERRVNAVRNRARRAGRFHCCNCCALNVG
jgi:hypothetical protein